VSRLEAKGMWNHTLFWLTTDNGGMTYGSAALGLPPVAVGVSSNWPLRGGKTTLFEGGVRGVSFVSGGLVPVTARGTTVEGLMQHVDVPLTMAKLAQANWTLLCDDGMCDALDMWPTITNRAPSPRLEAPINVDTCVGPAGGGPPCSTESKFNALISARDADGLWKLIEANWQAPQCPNTTWCTGAGGYDGWWTNDPYRHIAQNNSTQAALPDPTLSGGGIWLFDLVSDPNEAVNMASSRPEIVTSLRARLEMFAQPSNGYRDPQLNIPHPRAYPSRHNGTWAPFVSDGATLPPQSTDYLKSVAGILEHASWD
jgi:arylsulfatase B/arylsulfatase I/J